jgi:hypothetical protein
MLVYGLPMMLTRVGATSAYSVTITSSPTGSIFVSVDGTPVTTPYTNTWDYGTILTLEAYSPVANVTGTQYVFAYWSNSGNQTQTYEVVGPDTVTAYFTTQYYLTVTEQPPSLVTMTGQGWYDSDTTANLTAPSVAGYYLAYWDVDGTSQGSLVNPISVYMDGPHTATAWYEVAPTMEIVPSNYTAKVINSTFLININIYNVTAAVKLVGFEFLLNYDPTLLSITQVNNGTFLESFVYPGERMVYYGPFYSPGQVVFAGFIAANSSGLWTPPFPSGSGTLASINFTVIYQPIGYEIPWASCNLTLQNDWSILGDVNANPVPHYILNGLYSVVPDPAGDLNFDGTVNILDAIILANAFMAKPGMPNWNPLADLNNDGVVNILDAIILASHFGETRPN